MLKNHVMLGSVSNSALFLTMVHVQNTIRKATVTTSERLLSLRLGLFPENPMLMHM